MGSKKSVKGVIGFEAGRAFTLTGCSSNAAACNAKTKLTPIAKENIDLRQFAARTKDGFPFDVVI